MNLEKCKRYKDVIVAPGTQMFEALEAGDSQAAEKIYRQCEADKRMREYRTVGSQADDPHELMNFYVDLNKDPCPWCGIDRRLFGCFCAQTHEGVRK